jgi:glutathione peroxidase
MTSLPFDASVETIDGSMTSLAGLRDKAILVVNVASKCGMTPQYTQLEALQAKYADRGFTVVGFPCNQFKGQEPGTNAEIAEFCSATYGVTFPLFGKIEVNGEGRHPIYDALTRADDAAGIAGDVQWNFEKFLIAPGGEVIGRYRSKMLPDDPTIVRDLEAALPR